MFEVLERFSKRGRNGRLKYYFKARCECGRIFDTRADDKATVSCGCIRNRKSGDRRRGNPALNRVSDSDVLRMKWAKRVFQGGYSDGDLSFNDFLELSQRSCFYCDSTPSNRTSPGVKRDGTPRKRRTVIRGEFTYEIPAWGSYLGQDAQFVYNGLDRLDSSLPHLRSNVVPCCQRCNWMKGKFSVSDFLNHIERIMKCQTKKI